MISGLTRSDIHELLESSDDDVRANVAAKVATEFKAARLSDSERRIAEDILRIMTKDAATRVRAAISTSLDQCPDVPRDLVLDMAKDVEQVALPVLEHSPVLTDDDLVEIVSFGTAPKLVSIAGRKNVGEKVSSALVDNGDAEVAAKLFENEGAVINLPTMNRALDRFGDDERVSTPMALRNDLPVVVVERLVTLVSDTIVERLVADGKVEAERAKNLVVEAREKATVALVKDTERKKDIGRLVRQLFDSGRLSHSVVLRSICMGEVRFFEEAMACLAGVPHEKAWVLIHDRGPLGFRALFSESGLPEHVFRACRIALDLYHELEQEVDPCEAKDFRTLLLERVLTRKTDIEEGDLDFLLRKLEAA